MAGDHELTHLQRDAEAAIRALSRIQTEHPGAVTAAGQEAVARVNLYHAEILRQTNHKFDNIISLLEHIKDRIG